MLRIINIDFSEWAWWEIGVAVLHTHAYDERCHTHTRALSILHHMLEVVRNVSDKNNKSKPFLFLFFFFFFYFCFLAPILNPKDKSQPHCIVCRRLSKTRRKGKWENTCRIASECSPQITRRPLNALMMLQLIANKLLLPDETRRNKCKSVGKWRDMHTCLK